MFARKALFILTALVTVALTGCMSAGDETAAQSTAQPAVTAESTAIPGTSGAAGYDWQNGAEQVETALTQLSEISEARVAIAGSTALVGVKFDSAYQGEMTERIREMISGIVKQADPAIEVVAVTSDEDDVNSIYGIADDVRAGAGKTFDDFKDDINAIVRNATTLR